MKDRLKSLLTSKRLKFLAMAQTISFYWPAATVLRRGGYCVLFAPGIHVEGRSPREMVEMVVARM
jgi:hypothetical protein